MRVRTVWVATAAMILALASLSAAADSFWRLPVSWEPDQPAMAMDPERVPAGELADLSSTAGAVPTPATPLIDLADPITLHESDNRPAPSPAPITLGGAFAVPPAPAQTLPARASDADGRQQTQFAPSILVETSGPHRIGVGKPAGFAIALTNPGSVTAQAVQLFVTLPDEADLIRAEPPPAHQSVGVLRFDAGDLASGTTRWIYLRIAAREPGSLALATAVKFSSAATATLQACRPELQIACQAPQQAVQGSPVVFRLSIRNAGDGEAQNVVLQPRVLQPTSGVNRQPKSVAVGTLAPGQQRSVHYKVAAIGDGVLALRFAVAEDNGSTAATEFRLQVEAPALQAAVTGPAGSRPQNRVAH